MLPHQRGHRRAFEGRTSGQQRVEGASEGVQVGAGVGGASFVLLKRHVVRRAEHASRRGELARRLRGPGDPEVADFHAARGRHEVGGLDVAVHDAPAVRVGERLGDRGTRLQHPHDGQAARAGGQNRGEVGAVEQLHHEVRVAVVLPDVVDDGDPPMLEPRRVLRSPHSAAGREEIPLLRNVHRKRSHQALSSGT
nr:hypothetical protein [Actinomadura decatromicini]